MRLEGIGPPQPLLRRKPETPLIAEQRRLVFFSLLLRHVRQHLARTTFALHSAFFFKQPVQFYLGKQACGEASGVLSVSGDAFSPPESSDQTVVAKGSPDGHQPAEAYRRCSDTMELLVLHDGYTKSAFLSWRRCQRQNRNIFLHLLQKDKQWGHDR